MRQAIDRKHLRACHGDREQYPLYEKLAEVLAVNLLVWKNFESIFVFD